MSACDLPSVSRVWAFSSITYSLEFSAVSFLLWPAGGAVGGAAAGGGGGEGVRIVRSSFCRLGKGGEGVDWGFGATGGAILGF